MKEENVASLASLFKTKPETLSPLIENGGLDEFIETFAKSHTIMTADDFEKFKANHKQGVIDGMQNGEIPKPIYDRVKGTVLEMKEKELSKKFGIESFDGFDDLVGKIVESKAKNPEDVTKLKAQIDQLSADYTQKLQDTERQYNDRFISIRLNEVIGGIPIDADGVKLENQRDIIKTMVKANFGFKVNGDQVVITKGGEPIVDSKLDPVPMMDVIMTYAKDYVNLKSPGSGGRGDGSSAGSSLKSVSMSKYMKENGIKPNSFEHARAVKDFKEKGIEILE